MRDTSPEMEAKFAELMMQRSGEERMRMADSMFVTAREIVLSSLPPDLSDVERRIALAERFYGDEPELVKGFAAYLRKQANPE
jgi:hypothetical protein